MSNLQQLIARCKPGADPQIRPAARLALLSSMLLGGCAFPPISPHATPSALDPRGPAAAHIADLWWVMFWLSMVIFAFILSVLGYIMVRRRHTADQTTDRHNIKQGWNWLIWGGVVLPLVVMIVVFGFTLRTFAALNELEPEITVEIVGRRWWWEVIYPGQDVITANEIHIPVGVPVRFELKSADVIHSFWVPQLHGKMDAIPGRVNSITIQADEVGVYRGLCAEFCGVQHAHMGFLVVVQGQAEYEAWLEAQHQPAVTAQNADSARGLQVFLEAGCTYCHGIRGLDARVVDASATKLGPDLTHFNSRYTLGAGTLWNNRGNLAGWIMNAQHIKPGSLMPPMLLSSEELHAIVMYLESLD